eukprot:TRINITY_DN25126_c0_g1_i1.p1 TRINITY_DN25126_c0_g1~~TRINITY_DN25126_c0_g1_i1.p1  ORF type:complete len:358 (+),score=80.72 TRINITY_DN25126_c0_g1_i1:109-1182(+)
MVRLRGGSLHGPYSLQSPPSPSSPVHAPSEGVRPPLLPPCAEDDSCAAAEALRQILAHSDPGTRTRVLRFLHYILKTAAEGTPQERSRPINCSCTPFLRTLCVVKGAVPYLECCGYVRGDDGKGLSLVPPSPGSRGSAAQRLLLHRRLLEIEALVEATHSASVSVLLHSARVREGSATGSGLSIVLNARAADGSTSEHVVPFDKAASDVKVQGQLPAWCSGGGARVDSTVTVPDGGWVRLQLRVVRRRRLLPDAVVAYGELEWEPPSAAAQASAPGGNRSVLDAFDIVLPLTSRRGNQGCPVGSIVLQLDTVSQRFWRDDFWPAEDLPSFLPTPPPAAPPAAGERWPGGCGSASPLG